MEQGGMHFREWPIPGRLLPFVKCIWSTESDRPIYDAAPERILPDGCVELVFHFHDPFRTHFGNGNCAVQPRSFFVGQMKHFLEIEPAGRMGLIAVRFHARGAYRFVLHPLSAIADNVVDVKEVWKERADEWTERIGLAQSIGQRVRIIVEALGESLEANGRRDRAVDRCLELIESNGGQPSVKALASHIGISNRQLGRRFENAVGVSPKEFSRGTRFRRALAYLKSQPNRTLTETALDCGYFDQAHFNHEFRQFAGMTPKEFSTFAGVVF